MNEEINQEPISENHHPFLGRALEGRSNIYTWLGSIAIILIGAFILGGIPFLITVFIAFSDSPDGLLSYLLNPYDFNSIPIDFNIVLVTILMQFLIGFIAIWFCAKVIMKRSLLSFITAKSRFRWGKFTGAMTFWMLLCAIGIAITAWMQPGSVQVHLSLEKFIPLAIVCLVMLPFQTGFEELFFRGVIAQALYVPFRKMPFLPLLISSILFGLMHIMNPEVGEYGFGTAMVYYIGFGLLLAISAFVDDGLEVAWGVHFGNNFFSFVFVGYSGMAIETPSALVITSLEPGRDLLISGISFLLLFLVFHRKQLYRLGEMFR